ncbi:MAG: 50S ribosomal protein L3 [Legionellales bacterium]|nr:50S ribosomal protein L3 [Legionellales bacterium]
MSLNLIGKKLGQTQIFCDDGSRLHVTVIEVQDHYVTQVKTVETDGYNALQLATVTANKGVTMPLKGHYKSASVPAQKFVKESRVAGDVLSKHQTGSVVSLDWFEGVDKVDVSGVSKGKGFAGCVKRHGFRTQDATHGNSLAHRAPGSIGQCQDPGKVFKGKKMAGQMGSVKRTTLGLTLVSVDKEHRVLLVKGAVPGSNGSYVQIRKSLRHSQSKGGSNES